LPIPKGRIRLLRLTERGHEAARSLGLNPNPFHRKGGIEHEYWKKRVAEHYRKRGYRVIMEYPLNKRLKDRLSQKVSGLGDSRVKVSGPEEFG